MFNFLPNNRQVNPPPLFYDSRSSSQSNVNTTTNTDPTALSSTNNNNVQNSNFSNFSNFKAMLDQQHRQRSKYFDVYYPHTKDQDKNIQSSDRNSECESLNSSQSSDPNEFPPLNHSDLIRQSASRKNSTISCYQPPFSQPASRRNSTVSCYNQPPFSQPASRKNSMIGNYNQQQQQINNKNNKKDEIKNFNLQSNPVQFNMDKVTYVKSLDKTQSIVDLIMNNSKVIALNCDSDCCLQSGIDLLEVAVTFDESLDHPDIYIFDVYQEPKIIELFKPVFANASIVKVMFDARYDLRILSRKYGVTEFIALFDLQLAYRVLLAKLTKTPFDEIKREKLLYVSWQCNGPLTNFEKLYLPNAYYFKNRSFWKKRPVNFELMYNAAYDVFVMVPQLFTNLIIIMERTLNDEHKQLFIRQSDNLITKNLTSRKFAFFQTKQQYLNEMHKQIDLLIHSDSLNRVKLASKWQMQVSADNENSLDREFVVANSEEDEVEENDDDDDVRVCSKCSQQIKNNKLTQLIDSLKSNDDKSLFFGNSFSSNSSFCTCFNQSIDLDDEVKCMNLLVDQIIDLAECKEDYMELDE